MSLVRRAVAFVALTVATFAVARWSLDFRDVNTDISALWPAGGLLLAVYARSPSRWWPAVCAASAAGLLAAQLDARGLAIAPAVIALVHTAMPLAAVGVMRGRTGAPSIRALLDTRRGVAWFVSGTWVASGVGAAIGAALLGATAFATVTSVFCALWLSTWAGMVTFAPFALVFGQPRRGDSSLWESWAALGVMAILSGVMFAVRPWDSPSVLHYPFLVFPVLFWSALRARQWAAYGVLATMATIGSIGTVRGNGPFARADLPVLDQFLVFLLFLVVAVVCTLFARANGEERERAVAETVNERERFASILRAATEFSVIATDLEGIVTEFNQGAQAMLGYTHEEAVGRLTPAAFHLPDEVVARAQELGIAPGFEVFVQGARAGKSESRTWTYVRRDGHHVAVSLTVSAIFDADGQPTGFIGIAQDIGERLRAEEELRRSAEQHRLIVRHLPDAVISLFDRELRCEMIEGGAMATLGRSNRQYLGKLLSDSVPADDFRFLEPHYRAALTGRGHTFEYTSSLSGRRYDVELVPVPDEHGDIMRLLTVSRDITERHEAQQALITAEERARTAFERAPIGMALVDLEGRPTKVNEAFYTLTGQTPAALRDITLDALCEPPPPGSDALWETILRQRAPTAETEARLKHPSGRSIDVVAHSTIIEDDDGAPTHFMLQLLNVTQRKATEHHLQHLADHDSLTGLSNRRRFEADLEYHVEHGGRFGGGGALIMLDIDHFKQVNDTLGHQAGDDVIVTVADTLRRRLRETDRIARLGGDEFAVLLPNVTTIDAAAVAGSLLQAVRDAVVPGATEQLRSISLSIGVAMFGGPGDTPASMLDAADQAMYEAKRGGRDRFSIRERETAPVPRLT